MTVLAAGEKPADHVLITGGAGGFGSENRQRALKFTKRAILVFCRSGGKSYG